VKFSSNLSAIYTKCTCTQTLPPIFGLFAIFDPNFSKTVAPPKDEDEIYVLFLKEQFLLKKTMLTPLKSANKRRRNACSNCPV